MKRLAMILGSVLLIGALGYPVFAHGPGWGRGHHNMMGGSGHGMGPGMMGPGYGMDTNNTYGGEEPGSPYMSPVRPKSEQLNKPLKEKDARAILKDYLNSTGNPNLKLGKIEEKALAFEAEIVTKEGSLVDKIAVDKKSGWMRSIY